MLPPKSLSQEEAAEILVSQFVHPLSDFNALGSIKLFVPLIPKDFPTLEFEVDPEGLGVNVSWWTVPKTPYYRWCPDLGTHRYLRAPPVKIR